MTLLSIKIYNGNECRKYNRTDYVDFSSEFMADDEIDKHALNSCLLQTTKVHGPCS